MTDWLTGAIEQRARDGNEKGRRKNQGSMQPSPWSYNPRHQSHFATSSLRKGEREREKKKEKKKRKKKKEKKKKNFPEGIIKLGVSASTEAYGDPPR